VILTEEVSAFIGALLPDQSTILSLKHKTNEEHPYA
jgi:hypothetical protein